MKYRSMGVGDPAPWFEQRSTSNPAYKFSSAAGRYIVLCFFGSAARASTVSALKILSEQRDLFDDDKIAFFGVSNDPDDELKQRVRQRMPGIRYFWDSDLLISKEFGVAPIEAEPGTDTPLRRAWYVLDPTLRVMAAFPFTREGGERHEVAAFLAALPPVDAFPGFQVHAPVLVLPNVFEPDFCRQLIALHEADGGNESGFMREKDGKTVLISDHAHKRRSDVLIGDTELIGVIHGKIGKRIVPEIRKVHQFTVTRMERYLVGCYDAQTGGHFGAHRDNTTKGTAHRRFAVSINLNADFEGGEVSFPEYGARSFKPPPGGGVVFSCSLLHAVSQVTRGKRFAFLPFLYDDAAARLREDNQVFMEAGGSYLARTS
ncbi:2OG-Fe(II) oxygenase [Bosea sp. 2RAB26]|uniref:2OG-Fe(II) oxygenase n=1 Tax=Bosea sp. 2RAB26 TaxID=3237476 RepID=UPI003F9160AD